MLFAAEGGGFFSAAASGYSKGLTLLLLGQKNEDKRIRVSPWNQYQLVDQEPNTDLRLASIKNRLSRGCASLICFGRASSGLNSPSPLKEGSAQRSGVSSSSLVPDQGKDCASRATDNIEDANKFALKSSLKKRSVDLSVRVEDANEHDIPGYMDKRKVQWTDACGIELAEVREFEPSEMGGSDDEFQNGSGSSCACAIM